MLIYYDSKKDMTPLLMGHDIAKMLNAQNLHNRRIVILCIGSDRSTGDCLGPLIGYKLSGPLKHHPYLSVFGTLQAPVHAVNLVSTVNSIYESLGDPYIIAIDASLGKHDHIGFVTLGTGGLRPGLGVKKELPEVGDIHITGIVNVSGNADTRLLQTTRLSTIMTLADVITDGLIYTFNDMYSYQDITYQASYRRA
ncbi:MAG: spore protease YyaC [Bacteroides sp.]